MDTLLVEYLNQNGFLCSNKHIIKSWLHVIDILYQLHDINY